MKLIDEQRKEFAAHRGNNEVIHGMYDHLIRERLLELDPEFVKDLDEVTKGTEFWFA